MISIFFLEPDICIFASCVCLINRSRVLKQVISSINTRLLQKLGVRTYVLFAAYRTYSSTKTVGGMIRSKTGGVRYGVNLSWILQKHFVVASTRIQVGIKEASLVRWAGDSHAELLYIHTTPALNRRRSTRHLVASSSRSGKTNTTIIRPPLLL